MSENELAKIAVDISYRIHQGLGPGLLESVYEEAFVYELRKNVELILQDKNQFEFGMIM